jgi:hypothetical protein
MKAAWIRLALVSALFIGWLGYLGYLVAERPDGGTMVLSRPQFQVSDLDVVANVTKGSNLVTVVQVLYPNTESEHQLVGKELRVTNLADCRPPGDREKVKPDLTADGEYLLALQEEEPDGKEPKKYRVTATPPSPGFRAGTPRIYAATRSVLAQYRDIPKR